MHDNYDDYDDYGYSGFSGRLQEAFGDIGNGIMDALLPQIKEETEKLEGRIRQKHAKLDSLRWKLRASSDAAAEDGRRLNEAKQMIAPDGYRRAPEKFLESIEEPAWSIISYRLYAKPKCQHCGRTRMVTAVGPNGQKENIPCSCSEGAEDAYLIVQRRVVFTGIGEYPAILLYLNYGSTEYSFVHKDRFNPPEGTASTYRKPLIFSTEAMADAFARAAGVGKRLDIPPEPESIRTEHAI